MPKEVKWAISFLAGAVLLWVGWKVYFVLVTLHVMICGLLIVVVLLQSGEAADLAGAFGGAGSQTAFGPRGAATFLSKATTWCAVMFMLTSMALTMHINTTAGTSSGSSVLQQFSKSKSATPAAPAPGAPAAPAQSAPGAPASTPAATPPPATPPASSAPAQSAPKSAAPAPAPAKQAPSSTPAAPAAPAAPPAAAPAPSK
jgi:preprotein translocase subunit SecG